ncbi:MAG: Membrane protein insertase YidC [Pseudomonadota bacterium]|jgi:YidC/Oxa1 family membrane protein insertase
MNDIRRTILWVIFGFSMVMLWDQWQLHNGKQATFFPVPPKPTAAASAPLPGGAPVASGVPAVVGAASVPGTSSGAPTVVPVAVAKPKETIVLKSDVLRLDIDTDGGSVVRSEFLKHVDTDDRTKNVVLLDQSPSRRYVAQTGVVGGTVPFPTHVTPMTASPGERSLGKEASAVELRLESADLGGVKLIKTYTLARGSYAVKVRHDITNTGAVPLNPQLYVQLVRDGTKPPGDSAFYSTFTGPAVYTEAKKYQKVEFADIDKGKIDIEKNSANGYVAMAQHYFASAWLLADGVQRELFMRKVDNNLYSVGMITPLGTLAPGASKSVEARLFAGPQEENMLEGLTPGLELLKDYGWLTVLAKPLYWLLVWLYSFIQNWGWAIVALVFLLKVAFYWLNAKAYSSMAKMKAINPRVMEMRERLKDNPQQMQQEMMKIYREEKVNPLGGCFPIMVQIPVFIALYWVLLSSVEMRNAPWALWIKDLAAPDPYYVLPLVMTLTTMLQTALNPAPPDPMQAKLMWIMPLAFSVMFFFFPAGLVLYWITNNILSIAQQWIINTRMGVPPQFNLPKFS